MQVVVVVEILPLAMGKTAGAISVLPRSMVDVHPRLVVKSTAKSGAQPQSHGKKGKGAQQKG